ncbi:thaumatin-like protein 1b [Momordica charantia]|uniref:Thaumatin-like protein 1b n=1 Tax=Momordica charantia TaxID=3673 RepID=A0A6J1CSI5_MOMCH|nr:thaumatin-like protein 1b [Momordica charantia]
MASKASLLLLLQLSLLTAGVVCDVIFHFDNQCPYSIWLAANPSIGDADPESPPDTLEVFTMPDTWTGSIWARTKCSNDPSFKFSCETGDCGSGNIICDSSPPALPVTLLNFAINQSVVHYELSLKHGFNIQVRIQPDGGHLVDGGSGPCPVVDCIQNIGNVCPASLVATNKDGAYVGCYSACDALKSPEYCCNSPSCQPDQYSKTFKNSCALAHTYPGDNSPPTYGCTGFNTINVIFCPII